jgi:hypothetical protein
MCLAIACIGGTCVMLSRQMPGGHTESDGDGDGDGDDDDDEGKCLGSHSYAIYMSIILLRFVCQCLKCTNTSTANYCLLACRCCCKVILLLLLILLSLTEQPQSGSFIRHCHIITRTDIVGVIRSILHVYLLACLFHDTQH